MKLNDVVNIFLANDVLKRCHLGAISEVFRLTPKLGLYPNQFGHN